MAFGSKLENEISYVEVAFGNEDYLDRICGESRDWYYDKDKTRRQEDACNWDTDQNGYVMYPDLCSSWLCDVNCATAERPCKNTCHEENYLGFFCLGNLDLIITLVLGWILTESSLKNIAKVSKISFAVYRV